MKMQFRLLDMDDLYLLHFLGRGNTLAESGKSLFLSPSSITSRVQKIERCLGVEILDRTTKVRWLNDAGKDFCLKARAALIALGEINDMV